MGSQQNLKGSSVKTVRSNHRTTSKRTHHYLIAATWETWKIENSSQSYKLRGFRDLLRIRWYFNSWITLPNFSYFLWRKPIATLPSCTCRGLASGDTWLHKCVRKKTQSVVIRTCCEGVVKVFFGPEKGPHSFRNGASPKVRGYDLWGPFLEFSGSWVFGCLHSGKARWWLLDFIKVGAFFWRTRGPFPCPGSSGWWLATSPEQPWSWSCFSSYQMRWANQILHSQNSCIALTLILLMQQIICYKLYL